MAFRFRRSVKLAPGIRLNLGKRGVGISAGVRGLHVGVRADGKKYVSAGIPGTGISATHFAGHQPRKAAILPGAISSAIPAAAEPLPRTRLHQTGVIVFRCIVVIAFVYLTVLSIRR